MTNVKKSRDERARDAENRQRESELDRTRDRAHEAEPPPGRGTETDETKRDDDPDARECHRRGCDERAAFVVLERYQEETGKGAVEAEARLCRKHTAEESPANLDGVYADYVFRVEPLPGTGSSNN
ncbi:hypothetical protein SAMN05216285_2101 [Natrinema salifodinae]|uniref:Uncharacterized protein n=1 Tax=Natrinema salifodinae TaxID=1202768 RepID=A0A1I0P3L9_9EURY|nr:hypothetical protein SAMN05216285_2101 [Natrinema salifodinae]